MSVTLREITVSLLFLELPSMLIGIAILKRIPGALVASFWLSSSAHLLRLQDRLEPSMKAKFLGGRSEGAFVSSIGDSRSGRFRLERIGNFCPKMARTIMKIGQKRLM